MKNQNHSGSVWLGVYPSQDLKNSEQEKICTKEEEGSMLLLRLFLVRLSSRAIQKQPLPPPLNAHPPPPLCCKTQRAKRLTQDPSFTQTN